MKRLFLNSLAIFVLIAFASLACSSKYAGYEKSASGLYYKLYKVGEDTLKPKLGDWVSLNMRYVYKDSVLFDSKKAMGSPVRFQLPPSDFKGDIYEGIQMMTAGDSASFILNADSLFFKTFRQKTRPSFVDSNSVIYFYITLLSVDSPQSLMKKEEVALQQYIQDQKITIEPLPSGLYYIEQQAGKGASIDSGSWVKIHFKVSLIDGKQIFSSYEQPEPIKFEFGKRFDTQGMEEGVKKLKKGGKAKLIVPSLIGFGEMGRGAIVPPYSTLIYDIEIVDVQSKAEHEKELADAKKKEQIKLETNKHQETMLREKYLKEHNITAKPTPSGLIYVEKAKGSGAKAMAGKKVSVHYTGTLLNGTKFDSSRDRNQPFEFELGKGQVIKGWDEGIALMNVGGKATLIIPSSIGYGERDMGTIPPYSTLVFDVELLDIK